VSSSAPSVSVVVTTYEWPAALDVLLRALSEQDDDDFEVVVADDGSGPETADVVASWRDRGAFSVQHRWQPDDGWRKPRVLNLGALGSKGQYLVFVDGDSIPRTTFLRAIRRAMLQGWFVASKRLHLSPSLSQRVLDEHRAVWRWSAARWVVGAPREVFRTERESGRVGVLLPIRDRRRPWRAGESEFSAPYDAYGFCFGVWREDFERVNGFDLRFGSWGGEDVDLAVRLRRAGLRCGWPGAGATLLHLWHAKRKGREKSNTPLLDETTQSDRIEAVVGLRELAAELAAQQSAKRAGSPSSSSEPA
jgi:glycosyltransferase involved in cell wall biosynthesis